MSATHADPFLDRRPQWLAAPSPDDLVAKAYELADSIYLGRGGDEDEELSYVQDQLYSVLAEVFERWVPDAAWRGYVRDDARLASRRSCRC